MKKIILKITSVDKTELKLESGKNTFTIPATPDAIKKAKTAMRKGSNLSIIIEGENIKFGTSSNIPNQCNKFVSSEMEKYWDQYVPPVNKEHAELMSIIHNDSVSLRPSLLMLPDLKWK